MPTASPHPDDRVPPVAPDPRLTPTRATVNLAHLRHNARVLQSLSHGAPLMGVIKADAYGHGAVQVARALRDAGVRHFAVATVSEAVRLREAGLDDRILVFAAPLPDYLPAYATYDLDVTVPSAAVADQVAALARTHSPVRAHVKVDTGMGRIGLTPADAPEVIRRLLQAPGVSVVGVWTHFASAGDPSGAFTREQLALFDGVLRRLDGLDEPTLHTASSSAMLNVPESVHAFDRTLVRTGLALYGLNSRTELAAETGLRPVLRLTSRVTHLKVVEPGTTISYGRTWRAERRTRIATVGAGYADGYVRLLSNRAEVGLQGQRYPIAGTVCMDMVMVDLGDPDGPGGGVEIGDEVVLFGAGGPSAVDLARWAETIPYEVLCGISARVPRVYIDDPEAPR